MILNFQVCVIVEVCQRNAVEVLLRVHWLCLTLGSVVQQNLSFIKSTQSTEQAAGITSALLCWLSTWATIPWCSYLTTWKWDSTMKCRYVLWNHTLCILCCSHTQDSVRVLVQHVSPAGLIHPAVYPKNSSLAASNQTVSFFPPNSGGLF